MTRDTDRFFGVQTVSTRQTAFRVAATYALAGGAWILFSDQVLFWLVQDPRLITRLQTVKGWFFILASAALINWLVRRSLHSLRREDEKLREVAQGVSVSSGDALFTSLAKHLAAALEVDAVIICEHAGRTGENMRTLAAYADGISIDNVEYRRLGTPCQEVVEGRRLCSYPHSVRALFPGQPLLEQWGVESYIGTPLIGSGGKVLGVMAVMSRKPLQQTELAEMILPVFAVRAAVELERKQSEEALRESEALLRVVFDQSFQLMGLMKPDGTLIKINRTAFDFIKGREDEVLDKPFWETPWWTHSPEEQQRLRTAIEAAARGEFVRFETTHPKPDGEIVYVDFSLQPVKDDEGNVALLVPEGRDITERKRLEETLRTQFAQISTIFDSLNAVVYAADLESNELLYLNSYGAGIFREDWQGSSCCDILHDGSTGGCDACPSLQLVRNGVPQGPCHWETRDEGSGRWYQCTDKAIRWTDGRWVRMEIAVDITELKLLEQMKSDMAAVLSHEIRTPLTAMLGYMELMLENVVTPPQQQSYLTTLKNETLRLNELIDDFIDLQRLESSLASRTHVTLSIRPLILKAAELFAAASDRHRIQWVCDEDLPAVSGDEGQLRRALNNLISNAIKYSPAGGAVSFGARLEGATVLIWVQDEGIGIPEGEEEKIFEKFYRVKSVPLGTIRGTGLGLALVRETVEAHGGRVWVESRPGAGSTFYVQLPVMASGRGGGG